MSTVNTMEVKDYENCLVTKMLQNVFCVPLRRESHSGLDDGE